MGKRIAQFVKWALCLPISRELANIVADFVKWAM